MSAVYQVPRQFPPGPCNRYLTARAH